MWGSIPGAGTSSGVSTSSNPASRKYARSASCRATRPRTAASRLAAEDLRVHGLKLVLAHQVWPAGGGLRCLLRELLGLADLPEVDGAERPERLAVLAQQLVHPEFGD